MGKLPVVRLCVMYLEKVGVIRLFACLIFLFTFKYVAMEGLIWKAFQSHLSRY